MPPARVVIAYPNPDNESMAGRLANALRNDHQIKAIPVVCSADSVPSTVASLNRGPQVDVVLLPARWNPPRQGDTDVQTALDLVSSLVKPHKFKVVIVLYEDDLTFEQAFALRGVKGFFVIGRHRPVDGGRLAQIVLDVAQD